MGKKRRRNSLRYSGWDYRAVGYYFVTICTRNRVCLFDCAEYKHIAETVWQKIPAFKSATTILLDQWVVMPNHIHGIIVIVGGVSAETPPTQKVQSGSISALVGAYKAAVTNRLNHAQQTQGKPLWQRGYYDRIIRKEHELDNIRQYIQENPARWAEDRDNLDELLAKMTCHPS